jgi:hypothetical protein
MTLRVGFDLDGVLADLGAAMERHRGELFEAPSRVEARQEPARALLSARQQRQLWKHVESIENFWETLDETEPGIVARVAALASTHRWDVIFLTKRPRTAGATAQRQSQRWLEARGFRLPAVYVVQRSRGAIAAALGLDVFVDDRPENCLDVLTESTTRPVLLVRHQAPVAGAVRRLEMPVVRSMDECAEVLLDMQAAARRHSSPAPGGARLKGEPAA